MYLKTNLQLLQNLSWQDISNKLSSFSMVKANLLQFYLKNGLKYKNIFFIHKLFLINWACTYGQTLAYRAGLSMAVLAVSPVIMTVAPFSGRNLSPTLSLFYGSNFRETCLWYRACMVTCLWYGCMHTAWKHARLQKHLCSSIDIFQGFRYLHGESMVEVKYDFTTKWVYQIFIVLIRILFAVKTH